MLAEQGLQFRCREPGRNRAVPRQRRDPRPALLRQHDQEGEGHRLRLCRRGCGCSPSTARRSSRSSRARRPARACSAASWCPARAPTGRCRASSAAPRRWRSGCCTGPASSASIPTACRSMSARSRPICRNGTARVGAVARMFTLLAETDINLRMVNIGGGFPAQYRGEVAAIERLCPGRDRRADPAFRQPPARDHRRAGPLAGRRCRA